MSRHFKIGYDFFLILAYSMISRTSKDFENVRVLLNIARRIKDVLFYSTFTKV